MPQPIPARTQYLVAAALAGVAILATLVLVAFDAVVFRRFIGDANPLLAVIAVSVIFAGLAPLGLRRGLFAICGARIRHGVGVAVLAASLFGAVIIVTDLIVVFPPNLNVAFPASLLFYPIIAYGVSVLVHLLPFTVATLFALRLGRNIALWIGVAAIAAIEPGYQLLSGFAGGYPAWVAVFIFIHIYAINFVELVLLRRFDFVSMLALRLAYYAIWHIGWGALRLELLF